MAAARVIPVAPVNPPATPVQAVEPTPSVINMVGQSNKANAGEAVYTSVSDPAKRGSEAATAPKDWTIHRPEVEKTEDPPPPPLSKVLMDHLKTMWTAGASAIQVQQAQILQENAQPKPNAVPSVLATEVLTYSPNKVNKTEKA